MGNPIFGRQDRLDALKRQEVLGTVDSDSPLLDTTPASTSSAWSGPSGEEMSLEEGPPPWELEDVNYTLSDARRYVDVPDTWTLRWINPRLLESSGWQDWKPITVGDPRVKVKVQQMVTVDGNVRRGGSGTTSDILAYMPTHWVESRRRIYAERTAAQTQASLDKVEDLKESFRSGKYGPNVSLDSAKHPTHTNLDGRFLPKD